MSNIIPFSFEKLQVRVVTIDGEPWFVGKDVCDALGYKNATDAMNQHCRGVAKRYPISDSLGRLQETRVINEPDLMRLIVGSTLPAAQAFEKLVFETILPQVRKTGAYIPEGLTLDSLPPALASQIGGIIKSVVHKQIVEALRIELPVLLHGEMAKRQTSVRHGRTAGQIWNDYKLEPKLKNASQWLSSRLVEMNCQIAGGGRSESGGIPSKLFDPDKVAKAMKEHGLLAYCRQYAQQRRGQGPLFPRST